MELPYKNNQLKITMALNIMKTSMMDIPDSYIIEIRPQNHISLN